MSVILPIVSLGFFILLCYCNDLFGLQEIEEKKIQESRNGKL